MTGASLPAIKRSELTRRLASLQGFVHPERGWEQVPAPAEEASGLLWEALSRGDLRDQRVLDLGCGTGPLAIGAALLGAKAVTAVDRDPEALSVARGNATAQGVEVTWVEAVLSEDGASGEAAPGGDVSRWPSDTVLMNPPFGAQRRGADRPFLQEAMAALAGAPRGAIYMWANAASQGFIERWSLARHLSLEERRRTVWPLPRSFPHHREARGGVEVDRWILRRGLDGRT